MNRKKVAGFATAGAVLALLIAGCGGGAAEVGTSDPGSWENVNTPSGFGYSAYQKCNHGNRVYIIQGGGIAVVPADPSCREAK